MLVARHRGDGAGALLPLSHEGRDEIIAAVAYEETYVTHRPELRYVV